MRTALLVAASLALGTLARAEGRHGLDLSVLPEPGSVATEDGLRARERIHKVVTHPRCLNCHVGADNVPL